MRELSTDMQIAWVERIFSRLQALYGAAFGRQWDGANVAEVKAVWAEKLGGFTAPSIGGALKACDDRPYPPNAPEFVGLCRDAARRLAPPMPALPSPEISREEMEERQRQISAVIRKPEGRDHKAWAKEFRARYLAGDSSLMPIQIQYASEALHEAWANGQCSPVREAA